MPKKDVIPAALDIVLLSMSDKIGWADAKHIILEIKDLVTCNWCGELANGYASWYNPSDGSKERQLSCGGTTCGVDFSDESTEGIFVTRNRLLQIAMRCLRAESQLAELAALAKECDELLEKAKKSGIIEPYTEKAHEAWTTILDFTTN